jgi:hypothetical protein
MPDPSIASVDNILRKQYGHGIKIHKTFFFYKTSTILQTMSLDEDPQMT